MNKMHRFLVTGSVAFNNYYLVQKYLQQYLPSSAIICNFGGGGTDLLAAVYANCNDHLYEAYAANITKYGKRAGEVRNNELVRMIDHAIIFCASDKIKDNKLLQILAKRNIKPVIIEITEDDIIKPYKTSTTYQVDPVWDNPFPESSTISNLASISLYTSYLLHNTSLLRKLPELKDKPICNLQPDKLWYTDVLNWLVKYALNEINSSIIEKQEKYLDKNLDKKKPLVPVEVVVDKWDKTDRGALLYTTTGLLLSKGFSNVVINFNKVYLEINDKQMLKTHIWMSMESREQLEEDPINVYYKPIDNSKIEIFYRQVSFDDDVFKTGRWYIDVSAITTKD